MKHIRPLFRNRLNAQDWANCNSCMSSCQSACKTSATVGSSICHKKSNGQQRVNRPTSKGNLL